MTYVSCVVFICLYCNVCRYKVHYVGYSSKHDEWKFESDLYSAYQAREEEEESK